MSKPPIRFNGHTNENGMFQAFTEDWEQRKLGECFAERKESMPDGELISVTIGDGIKKFSELGRHDNSNDDKSKYKKVCVGDIAYNSMRMWQGASGFSPYEGIVSPAYTVLSPNTDIVDSKCISYLFKRADMTRVFQMNSQGITSDNWNLKYPALSEIEISISPYLEEQRQIASYLSRIDSIITLHQRELSKLHNMKIGFLQKMFPQGDSKVPEIRFDGYSDKNGTYHRFTEDWERRKLNEYLEVSKVKNKDEIFGKEDVLSVSGDFGVVNQIEFQGRSFAGASVAPYGVVDTGDVIYTKSPLKSNPYGIIKTNKGKPGIVSTLYAVYKPLENVHPNFVQCYFEQDARMNDYMHPLVNKGAKNDMKVSDENALKGEVIFPSKEEQMQISEFFAMFDNLIILHQRELDILKRLKIGFLQKMFA